MFEINYWFKYFVFFASFKQFLALDFNWENDAIQKYSRLKILSDCLGNGFVQSWKESLKSSTEKCFSEESFGEGPSLVSLLEGILLRRNIDSQKSGIYPTLQYPATYLNTLETEIKTPYAAPTAQNPFFVYMLPFAPQHLQHQPTFPVQHPLQYFSVSRHANAGHHQPTKRIWKRSTTTDEEVEEVMEEKTEREGKKINLRAEWRTPDMEFDTAKLLQTIPKVTTIRKQLGNRISNITCVLKSMELLDENGSPNYSYNSNLINRLNVPESLRSSFREAQDFCREFSMCVPIHRMSDVVVKEVGYSLVFMKCMKKMILQACVAHDMKNSMENYGLEIPDLFTTSDSVMDRSSYASRSGVLFEETPVGVSKNLENILEAQDEIAFGF